MNILKLWFYRIFRPSKCIIGIDISNGVDYTVKSYGYKDSKGVIRIVKTIIEK